MEKLEEKCCLNCGYREREHPHKQKSRIYCTNINSEKCFRFVKKKDVCPLWVEYTEITKYFTEWTQDYEDCGKAEDGYRDSK